MFFQEIESAGHVVASFWTDELHKPATGLEASAAIRWINLLSYLDGIVGCSRNSLQKKVSFKASVGLLCSFCAC